MELSPRRLIYNMFDFLMVILWYAFVMDCVGLLVGF